VLDESQKDEIRTYAMDRGFIKNHHKQDIMSLKVRPVICKDLTIFGTPRTSHQ